MPIVPRRATSKTSMMKSILTVNSHAFAGSQYAKGLQKPRKSLDMNQCCESFRESRISYLLVPQSIFPIENDSAKPKTQVAKALRKQTWSIHKSIGGF